MCRTHNSNDFTQSDSGLERLIWCFSLFGKAGLFFWNICLYHLWTTRFLLGKIQLDRGNLKLLGFSGHPHRFGCSLFAFLAACPSGACSRNAARTFLGNNWGGVHHFQREVMVKLDLSSRVLMEMVPLALEDPARLGKRMNVGFCRRAKRLWF